MTETYQCEPNLLRTNLSHVTLHHNDDNNSYAGEPRVDKDRDGMADDWERQHGGDLEPRGRDIHDVYENIEVYLDDLADELVEQMQPIAAHTAVMEAERGLRRP